MAPNRWLVIRRLEIGSVQPESLRRHIKQAARAWIIESDAVTDLDTLTFDLADVDMTTQVAPFIDPSTNDSTTLERQAATFIGRKSDASSWSEARSRATRSVPLSIHASSNPLFADYTPHNANVFSMLDDFLDVGSSIEAAEASYMVLGWHSDVIHDPLHSSTGLSLSQLLESCQLRPDYNTGPLDNFGEYRTLCHGSMHFVKMSLISRPDTRLGDAAASSLSMQQPLAIGLNALDAMLAMSEKSPQSDSNNVYNTLAHVKRIFAHEVIDQGDSATIPVNGGKNWFLSGDKGKAAFVHPDTLDADGLRCRSISQANLKKMNRLQDSINCIQRLLAGRRYDLFSCWWTQSCEGSSGGPQVSGREIEELQTLLGRLTSELDELRLAQSGISDVETRSKPHIFGPKDPTLLVAGIGSPWPYDYLEPLRVRIPQRASMESCLLYIHACAKRDSAGTSPEILPLLGENLARPDMFASPHNPSSDNDMSIASSLLIAEFHRQDVNEHPFRNFADSYDRSTPLSPPLYHDICPLDGCARDQWNDRQPWLPLFVEWEARYHHIPFDEWSFVLVEEEDLAGNKVKVPRWKANSVIADPNHIDADVQICSGRIIVQPQPGLSLRHCIERAFASMSPNEIETIFQDKQGEDRLDVPDIRTEFLDKVERLPFMSAPLSGLHNQLATRLQGNHVKPTLRFPGHAIQSLKAAEMTGFDERDLIAMGQETSLTPFGTEVAVPAHHTRSPFKPVVHGQLCFSKINVIDKFGQAISALDPRYSSQHQPICPVVSSFYTAQPGNEIAPCAVQLPPTVNQDLRLNVDFLVKDVDDSSWRPFFEWEDPIEGWVIFNYAEEALQFFLPNGTFYREVRRMGSQGMRWLPFEAPTSTSEMAGSTELLDQLIKNLAISPNEENTSNLGYFMKALEEGCDRLQHASSDYAEFMSAIVGRPLALANIGVSMELAAPPKTNQSLINQNPPEMALEKHVFKVHLGDLRGHEGLVMAFDSSGLPRSHSAQAGFVDLIEPLAISPFYASPIGPASEDFQAKQNARLTRQTVLIDPFTPVNVLSGIVPKVKLQLPSWTIHSALRRMTAFFQMGPILTTAKEQPFREEAEPKSSDVAYLNKPTPPSIEHGKGIAIPTLQTADWNWLQPYADGTFNVVGIERLDNKPGFQQGPYTALHGYLQMKQSLDTVQTQTAATSTTAV